MYLMVYVVCFCILLESAYSSIGNRWDYQGTLGPDHWHVDYPQCGGSKQSPIDIDINQVELDTTLQHFDMSSYATLEGVTQEMENVGGHTVEVKYGGTPLIVRGGDLLGEYVVDQFHFHWGSDDSKGSEHKINGDPYPMEMHIVHHSSNFTNLTEALSKPNGLVVNGFFIQVGTHNPAFEELFIHFGNIIHAGNRVSLETSIKLSDLLPKDMEAYYRYDGSLTTPPCYETVTWTLFKTPIEISEEQLNKYRGLKRNQFGDTEESLVDDFRPLQALNQRVVLTNHKLEVVDIVNSANNNVINNYIRLFLLLFLQLLPIFLQS